MQRAPSPGRRGRVASNALHVRVSMASRDDGKYLNRLHPTRSLRTRSRPPCSLRTRNGAGRRRPIESPTRRCSASSSPRASSRRAPAGSSRSMRWETIRGLPRGRSNIHRASSCRPRAGSLGGEIHDVGASRRPAQSIGVVTMSNDTLVGSKEGPRKPQFRPVDTAGKTARWLGVPRRTGAVGAVPGHGSHRRRRGCGRLSTNRSPDETRLGAARTCSAPPEP